MSATTSSNAGDPVLGLEAAAARQRFRRRERADGLVRDASLDHGLTFRITGGDTSWEPGRAIGLGIGSAAVDAATDPAWVASLMHGEMAQKPPAGKRGHVAARQSALHPAQGASARSNESEGKRLAMTEADGFRGPHAVILRCPSEARASKDAALPCSCYVVRPSRLARLRRASALRMTSQNKRCPPQHVILIRMRDCQSFIPLDRPLGRCATRNHRRA
jgi:hypothetical protein